MSNYCLTLEPIPQFLGTCWFNAVLTCLLYSQGLSNVIRTKAIEDDWLHSTDVFKVVLNRIIIYIDKIKNTSDEDKRKELNKRLNKYLNDVKPELLLLKYTYNYDKRLYEQFKELQSHIESKIYKFNFYNIYIIYILQVLKINFIIDWYKTNKKTFFKVGDNEPKIEDYVIININYIYYEFLNKVINLTHLQTIDKVINTDFFNIDCCLIVNYPNPIHAIACITCNNDEYIYNGYIYSARQYKPCYFTQFGWKKEINSGIDNCFIINLENCNLNTTYGTDTDKMCFSFNYDNNQLIVINVSNKYLSISTIESSISPIDKYLSLTAVEDFYVFDEVNIQKNIDNILYLISIIYDNSKLLSIYIYLISNVDIYKTDVYKLRLVLQEVIEQTSYNRNLSKIMIDNIYILLSKLNKTVVGKDISLPELIKLVKNPDIYIDKYLCIWLLKILYYNYNYIDTINSIIRGITITDIKRLKDIFNVVIYYYYKANNDNEMELFYAIYHQLMINNSSLLSPEGIKVYNPLLIETTEYLDDKSMIELTLKQVYKIVLQYYQVQKIYDILSLKIDLYRKHLFYEFLFKLYYFMNMKKLNMLYICNFNKKKSFYLKYEFIKYKKDFRYLYIDKEKQIRLSKTKLSSGILSGIFIEDVKY